jgi:type VI secretion system protein ImpG
MGALVLPDGRLRFTLPATAWHQRNDEIGPLRVHINYLNDFHGSLKVLHALERHVDRVAVSFDERIDEHTKGTPCQMSLAAPDDDDNEPHPLAHERLYFHFPRSELFFELVLPSPPRNWQRFTLLFDVTADWPRNLRLTSDVFQLFATPIINLQRAAAQPIVHDGTQERWPIFHPTPASRHQLHSVRGVYRLAGDAQVPLRLATLAGGAGAYELADDPGGDGERHPALLLHLPEALAKPATVTVDAEWMQPWFSSVIGQRLAIAPQRRALLGVQWELSGEMVAHREPALGDAVDDFTHILVLQHQRVLSRDDLDALLQVLGSVWTGPFAPLRDLIVDVRVHQAPKQRGACASGEKLVYELMLKEHEAGLLPLVDRFAQHLARVLGAWIADLPIEVRIGGRR